MQHTYDFLFDRHLKVLTTMDQDEEELYNEDHLRAIGEETKNEYDTVCKF